MADPWCRHCDNRASIQVMWKSGYVEFLCRDDAPTLESPHVDRIVVLELDDVFPELQGYPDEIVRAVDTGELSERDGLHILGYEGDW